MTLRASLSSALRAIAANTLRSVLTTLGIIVGVASVIVMVSIGSGARSDVDRLISNFGTNLLVVFPGAAKVRGRSAASGTAPPMSERDLDAIRRNVPDVIAISGLLRGEVPVIRGNLNRVTTIEGVHTDYVTTRNLELDAGRAFDAQEVRSGARVALMGQTVAHELFPGQSPIGQIIRVRNEQFRIVGTLLPKGQAGTSGDQDDVVIVPITAVRARLIGRTAATNDVVGWIAVKMDDNIDLAAAKEDVEQVLRKTRRIRPGAEDNFNVRNLTEILEARSAAQTTLGWLLGATSVISLLVGGIGIMNIMLVSVTERTREIGLRMAVGARRGDIMAQFLVEATVLCLIGGAIGVAVGGGAAVAAASLAAWPVVIAPAAVWLALAAAAATGVCFGFFPAWRAAHLNPIEALRSE